MTTMPDRMRTVQRLLPLAGVLAVVLWIVGVVVIESTGTPDQDAAPAELATFFDENGGRLVAGGFLFMLGGAFFIPFLGALRARIHSVEGGVGFLAPIVFGAGLVTATLVIASQAPPTAGGFVAMETDRAVDPGGAEAFWGIGDGFFLAAEAAVAIFFLAAAAAVLATRALPVWLGWLALLLAIVALVPWIGWAALVWGLPLWTLIAAILMFVRAPHARTGEGTVAPPSTA